jgi:hypothetical protein
MGNRQRSHPLQPVTMEARCVVYSRLFTVHIKKLVVPKRSFAILDASLTSADVSSHPDGNSSSATEEHIRT